MVQVRGFLLACPSPLSLGAVVLSTPVSCMQLSALLFFVADRRGSLRIAAVLNPMVLCIKKNPVLCSLMPPIRLLLPGNTPGAERASQWFTHTHTV